MSHVKPFLLIIAATCVGFFVSASASAAPSYMVCLEVGAGTGHWLNSTCSSAGKGNWETREVTTALAIEGTIGLSDLNLAIAKTTLTITCVTGNLSSGGIEASGASKATIVFKGCSVERASNCTVPDITARVVGRLLENGVHEIEDEFSEEMAGPLMTLVISGSLCGFKGSFPVTGRQKCLFSEGRVFKASHLLDCEENGSSLKVGDEPMTYKGSMSLKLMDNDAFRVGD